MTFSMKSTHVDEFNYEDKKVEFVKDTSDNPLFKDIQVDDISKLIKPETVFYADFDMPVYQVASNLEVRRVTATCISDPSIVIDCKGVREFKGLGKKIADSSELGVLNLKRSLEGLPELSVEDFEVAPYQKLTSDEDKSLETAKIQIYKKLKEYRLQYDIPKVIPVLGEGESFREYLPTCKKYKSNRAETLRPLLLKKLRAWVVEELGGIMTTERHNGHLIECDDKIEMFANEGYRHYRKHGWFNMGVISGDKDSLNSPKLLINADRYSGGDLSKKGKLRFPKPMLIEGIHTCAGDVELVSKTDSKGATSYDVKGYGFKFLLFQALLGQDSADHYDALGHLGKGMNYGVASAYKTLKPCKTAKEALQAAIDVFAEKLPNGVEYVDHFGKEQHVDTMTYMDTYFRVAYMLRKVDDGTDFYKLCELAKVDVSKVTNNVVTEDTPLVEEDVLKNIVHEAKGLIEEALSEVEKKSGTKPVLVEKLESTEKLLKDINEKLRSMFQVGG